MLGQIQMESKIGGVSGLGKAMMNKFVNREAAIVPRYRGTGQIYLEPSFSHFLIYRLTGEEVIADKGMFYCGGGGLALGQQCKRTSRQRLSGRAVPNTNQRNWNLRIGIASSRRRGSAN